MVQAMLAMPRPAALVRPPLRRPVLVPSRASVAHATELNAYRDADDAQVHRAIQPVGPEDTDWSCRTRCFAAH
jgi:hypothetical protein